MVLLRVDFNVPLNSDFKILDDTRILSALPTIKKILNKKNKLIIMSHLGRPNERFEEKFSLTHLVKHLSNLPKKNVLFSPNCVGKPVLDRIKQRELLEVIMHRVISLDPGFNFSGPYRFFGSLYTRIPGIELSQSKTYFDQAITANPEYLGNKVLMAQFYYQKAGNR